MKLKKLLLNQTRSSYERMSEQELNQLLGGNTTSGGMSCGHTGSSCGCDNTAVCNCPILPYYYYYHK